MKGAISRTGAWWRAGAILALFTSVASAQLNPNGWIQTKAWNLLFPLQNPYNCSGGGRVVMGENWVAPHDLFAENPLGNEGEAWADIDFNGASPSSGWGAPAAIPDPTWVTVDYLEAAFIPGVPVGDVVDFQAMSDWINGNFGSAVVQSDQVLGIATTYVENTTGSNLEVYIQTASDDSIQVMVNDQLVTAQAWCRGTAGNAQEAFRAYLLPGINKIISMVWEGGGGWGFRLGIAKSDAGVLYTDLDPEIVYRGAGTLLAPLSGQASYSATRSLASSCGDAQSPVSVSVKGSGAGSAADQVTVIERLTKGVDAETLTISSISNGGAEVPAGAAGPFEGRTVVGNNPANRYVCDTSWDPAAEEYTSTAQTSNDIWDGGDLFEFAYASVPAGLDFDVSIKITGRQHDSGFGRWGKHGLMARETLNSCGRYTMMQDSIPNREDARRVASRRNFAPGCGDMHEYADFPGLPAHPEYMRLTRRGNLIQGWSSTASLAPEADPSDDARWVACNNTDGTAFLPGAAGGDDWGSSPAVFLGFANSEHNSDDATIQSIQFKIVGANVGGGDVPTSGAIPGQKTTFVKWTVSRGDLSGGLSYSVAATGGPVYFSKKGEVVDIAETKGSSQPNENVLYFRGAGVGALDYALDVGTPPTAGASSEAGGTYTISGSGYDIWDGGDDFQFAYKCVTGDFDAIAHVSNRSISTDCNRWGRHGLMARWGLARQSKFEGLETMFPTPDCGDLAGVPGNVDYPRFHYRLFDKINGNNRDGFNQVPPGFFPTEQELPTWQKLSRRGNAIYGYFSEDDGSGNPKEWKFIGSDTFSNNFFNDRWAGTPGTLLVGLYSMSHYADLQTADFDQVSITEVSEPVRQCDVVQLLTGTDYPEADGSAPSNARIAVRGGAFIPKVLGGRLRLTDEAITGSATAVWYPLPGTSILTQNGFKAEFDVFATKAGLPADPVPDVNPADGMTFSVVQGTPDALLGSCADHTEPCITDLPLNTFIGTDIGGLSSTTGSGMGPYVSTSTSGNDIWAGGDDFEFQYAVINGDFDIAIEISSYVNALPGRWGKVGLMARGSMDRCSKFTMSQAHGPGEPDTARQAGRLTDLDCGSMYEDGYGSGPQPRFLRLTRRGTVIRGYASNEAGLGDGTLDPQNDCNWAFKGRLDDWGAAIPGSNELLVGFANSEHGDAGVGTQIIEFRILPCSGGGFLPGTSLCGDGGGALAYENGTMAGLGKASFAVEFDNWVDNGNPHVNGEPGNEPGNGGSWWADDKYHVGIDINGKITSVQTDRDYGVASGAVPPIIKLPPIYDPLGVHAEVVYDPKGRVETWLTSNSGAVPRTKVLSSAVSALTGEVVIGFTGATGGATTTFEVDNVKLEAICCEQSADAVSISGATQAVKGDSVTLTANLTGVDDGATPSYQWSISSGAGQIVGSSTGSSVQVTSASEGDTVVGLTAGDGVCNEATPASHTISFSCEAATETVEIGGPTTGKTNETVTLTADNLTGVDPGKSPVYKWTIAGAGSIVGADDGASVQITSAAAGTTDVTLVAGDGLCTDATDSSQIVWATSETWGRCDANGDGAYDISDPVASINAQFLGGTVGCVPALDCNNDGGVDISDPVFDIQWQFLGGDKPIDPYPACDNFATCEVNVNCN